MPAIPDDSGIVSVPSPYSVAATLDRLEAVLEAKGNTIFARIDQQSEARKVGLDLRPTELIIFGNPVAGTPLMEAAPGSALGLPLKAVAWQDEQGQVWLSYNSPDYLQLRHHLTDVLMARIAGIGNLIETAVNEQNH